MRRSAPLVLALATTVSLGGCAHVPKFLAWLKPRPRYAQVKPIPLDIPPADPNAAEDRLYARSVRAIEDRDYGTALDVLQLAKEARPNDPRVLCAMGVVYDKLGRFDLSGRYYDLAEKADPGSKVVAINRQYSNFLRQHDNQVPGGDNVMLAANVGIGAEPAVATAKPALTQVAMRKPLGKAESANVVETADFSARGGFAAAYGPRGD